MKKSETVGMVGESIFEKIIKNKLPYEKLSNKSNTHYFDFIVNGLNIEIKTSKLRPLRKDVCFNWVKNNSLVIDYVIGIVLDEFNNFIGFYHFDNKFINEHVAKKLIPNIVELKKNNKALLLKILNQ